jgi:hypothetical protein
MRQQSPAREHDRAALADPSARLIVELVDTADMADGHGNAVQWRAV